ncbi:hypothetical protein ABFS83_11G032700 [Erythranthe nasuta]
MRQPIRERELPGMNSMNSVLNQHQILSLEEIHNHGQSQMFPSSSFDPASSHDDFLEQILSSVSSSAAASSFPWAEDQPASGMVANLEEQSAALASKMRQQQIGNGGAAAAKTLMLQQQLLLARGLAAGNEHLPHSDYNDAVDGPSSNYANLANDASIKALLNGFTGSLGQTSNQSQHFHHSQRGALQQSENFGAPAAPAMSQPAASGSAGQPRQRVRARRGQATDPHSIAERLRRERIAERMKGLQELVPNANKTDKASMLDEIIDYVKFLQLQVKVLSMSRLGGAAAASPLLANKSHEGRGGKGAHTAASSSSNKNEGATAAEQQVAKLMEEDMGSAMQYLQGKGLCLMPISLATAISTATGHSRNPLLHGGGDAGGPLSPSLSALTVQSATMGGGDGSLKDTAAE